MKQRQLQGARTKPQASKSLCKMLLTTLRTKVCEAPTGLQDPLNKQCAKGTFPRVMNVKYENTQTWWKDGYSKNIFHFGHENNEANQWRKYVIRECLFTGQITTVWLSNQDFGLGYFPFQWTQKAMEPISLILTYLGFISKAYVSD